MKKLTSICVYCGSQPGNNDEFGTVSAELGKILAEQRIRLVYGGGTRGLMGAVAKGCHENSGSVTGIIPQFLLDHEANNEPTKYCNEVIVTQSMHERKQIMFERSDAFLAMPGGIGTLEELVEIMTWAQLGRHDKPVGIMSIEGFWDPLIELFDHMKTSGFIHTENRVQPAIITDVNQVIETLSIV
jgi:uncharacterized protein (TIGR00730 family)